MNYIREIKNTQIKKNKTDTNTQDEKEKIPSFFTYPTRQSKLTFLKAPMAHKTFSQEQFITKSYTMSISFNNNFKKSNSLKSINNSIFMILYLKKNFLIFESNLLFLKRLKITMSVLDPHYMSI